MTRVFASLAAAAMFAGLVAAQDMARPDPIIISPDDIKWVDGPPTLPAGVQMAVIEGDPTKEEYFMVRLKLPAGCRIAPHVHGGDERITVISGAFSLGLGEAYDETKLKKLVPGSYVSLPRKTSHFVSVAEETIVQLATVGPWTFTYIKDEDDPRKK